MTNLNSQLNRLLPALSGRERAILAVHNYKEGKPADDTLRYGMSRPDAVEYNRLIGVMNACNGEIGTVVLLLSRTLDSLEVREAWLLTLQVWQLNLAEIDFAVTSLLKEPITESEHEKLKEADGRKYAPVDKLATIVAIEQRGWQDDDLEQVEWSGDSVVKDDAWKRLQADAEAQLRQAAADGELKTRGEGKELQIEVASFNALVGAPWGVRPKWVDDYEVRPDDEAGRVEGDRRMLAHLQESVTNSLLARLFTDKSDKPLTLEELVKRLKAFLRFAVDDSWKELRGIDLVLEEVAADFNGEDVLGPKMRELVEATRARLMKLGNILAKYNEGFEFEEPPEETLESLRALIWKAAAR